MTVGADAAVVTDAANVTVMNGNDVTISDIHNDLTTFDVTAKGAVELASVSDIEGTVTADTFGTVTADTFIIDSAENATFETTVANLSVNGVKGVADIMESDDVNMLSGSMPGMLYVTADGDIVLGNETVIAGGVSLTGIQIVVDGDATVAADQVDVEFNGPVTGNGTLTATADNTVRFSDDIAQDGRLDVFVRGDVAEFRGDVEVGFIDVAAVSQALFEHTLTATETDPYVTTDATNHAIRVSGDQVFFKDDVTATAENSKIQVVADELMLGGDVPAKPSSWSSKATPNCTATSTRTA